MRMRRLPWAADFLQTASCRVMKPEEQRGKWHEVIPGKKFHLEIGCGKGGYSVAMAGQYPQESFLAVEKNESAAGLAAKKMEEASLANLRLVYGDAANLYDWFDDGEVDVIHLNFSDPWPKKRNAKRRLSAPSFLKEYERILSKDGEIQMKTDNSSLFEYSLLEMEKAGFVLSDVSVDFRRNEHPEDAMTEYEKKFTDSGQPVYRAVWKVNK